MPPTADSSSLGPGFNSWWLLDTMYSVFWIMFFTLYFLHAQELERPLFCATLLSLTQIGSSSTVSTTSKLPNHLPATVTVCRYYRTSVLSKICGPKQILTMMTHILTCLPANVATTGHTPTSSLL